MSLDTGSAARTLEFTDLGLGSERIDYLRGWELQREVHAEVVAGRRPDTVLLLEHDNVYTAGKRTEQHERPVSGTTPVIDVDRGGKLTWHGRGQLVAYPIVKLPDSVFVVDYVRRLEEAMIRTFADLGLAETTRIEGRSGVWLDADDAAADPADGPVGRPARKIAAIGIRVASQVTMHGIAMNITNSLEAYDRIVPCGITDAGVTTLAAETGRSAGLREVADRLQPHLVELLGWQPYQQS